MNIINHYRTPNLELVNNRCVEYLNRSPGCGTKNFNVNKITYFREIPDDCQILVDYVDVTSIRTMYIPTDIIYHSIWLKYPELFEDEE